MHELLWHCVEENKEQQRLKKFSELHTSLDFFSLGNSLDNSPWDTYSRMSYTSYIAIECGDACVRMVESNGRTMYMYKCLHSLQLHKLHYCQSIDINSDSKESFAELLLN